VDALDLLARQLMPHGPLGQGARARAEAELERARRQQIEVVTLVDPAYPETLRAAPEPPLALYVQGDLQGCLARPAVAIVGSREATARGRSLAFALARDLARAGCIVVSGLARGIDTAAHEGALAGGTTLAVQGRGLDAVYPPENAGLARRLLAGGGAIVSEFALGVPPRPHHFPLRNRILAGLVRVVVVVEATERSGALVTARLALDAGRDVLAVPGHPYDARARGANALLHDGAGLVRDAQDVLDALGLVAPLEARPPEREPVLAAIDSGQGISIEELTERTGLSMPALLARLGRLELEGTVARLPGPLFVRA
jgi:DNA processing protein